MKMKAFLVSIALLTSGGLAHAVPVQVDFTANNFSSGSLSTLSGSFFYEAASLTSTVDSLAAVDLSINGHAYTPGEIGFLNTGTNVLFGGWVHGLNAIVGVADHDFLFVFDRIAQSFSVMAYSTPGLGQQIPISSAGTVSIHEPTPTGVPEPATLTLMSLGLLGIAMRRRKST